MHHNNTPTRPWSQHPNGGMAHVVYPIPDPFRSLEEWERWRHLDLPELSTPELLRERARLRLRLTLDDAPDSWCLERLQAIEGALRHAR